MKCVYIWTLCAGFLQAASTGGKNNDSPGMGTEGKNKSELLPPEGTSYADHSDVTTVNPSVLGQRFTIYPEPADGTNVPSEGSTTHIWLVVLTIVCTVLLIGFVYLMVTRRKRLCRQIEMSLGHRAIISIVRQPQADPQQATAMELNERQPNGVARLRELPANEEPDDGLNPDKRPQSVFDLIN